jgi:hypothetical protein
MIKVPSVTINGCNIEYHLVLNKFRSSATTYPIPAIGIIGINTPFVVKIVSPRVSFNVLMPSTLPSQGDGKIASPGRIRIAIVKSATKNARAASARREMKSVVGVMHIELLLLLRRLFCMRNVSTDIRILDRLPVIWGR